MKFLPLLIALSLFGLSACGLFGPKPNSNLSQVYVPPKRDTPPPAPKVDTQKWCDTLPTINYKTKVVCYLSINGRIIQADTVASLDFSPPPSPTPRIEPQPEKTTTAERIVHPLKKRYKIALILPFFSKNLATGKDAELHPRSLRAVEFYEGVKLALLDLERQGHSFHFLAYDSQRDEEVVREILEKPELQDVDMIIGPISSAGLKQAADFAAEKQIPLISPFNPLDNVVDTNPYYIQVSPSFRAFGRQTLLYAKNKLPGNTKKYLLLGMQSDSARLEQIQQAYALIQNDPNARLPQYLSPSNNLSYQQISPYLQANATNIVLVPHYEDEQFVQTVLQSLGVALGGAPRDPNAVGKDPRGSSRLYVFGPQQWRFYERMGFDYYEYNNLHLATEVFSDPEHSPAQQFRQRYIETYGIAPRDFGLLGYDLMLFFGDMLKKYGANFPQHLPKEARNTPHGRFEFTPVYPPLQKQDLLNRLDDPNYQAPTILRYENQFIQLIEFDNYEFKRVH